MANKAKLELHHLALLSYAPALVMLCKRNEYTQLSYDKWMVRYIDSDRDDFNDRREIRESELIPLAALSKNELRKCINELKGRYEWNGTPPAPSWTKYFPNPKATKAALIDGIEKMWDDHSCFYNKKKQEEKQRVARAKEDREYLLQDFRTMNPTTVGMYIPFIIEQLTDDQVRTLRRQINSDERELTHKLGPISIFGSRFP